jgi:hypothetical protein
MAIWADEGRDGMMTIWEKLRTKATPARVRAAVVLVALVSLCFVMRVVPHAWNVTPVAATALFAGFYFRSRLVAVVAPLGALLIGDLLGPGVYDWRLMLAVYACLTMPILLGRLTRGRMRIVRIVGASLVASIVFYLVTNLASFFFMPFYDRSITGLIECYVAALPFFRNTVLGDLAWTMTLFGAYAVAPVLWKSLAPVTCKREVAA